MAQFVFHETARDEPNAESGRHSLNQMRGELELRAKSHSRIRKIVLMKPLSPDQRPARHDEQQMARKVRRRDDWLGFRECWADDRKKLFPHQEMRCQPAPVSVSDADYRVHSGEFEVEMPDPRMDVHQNVGMLSIEILQAGHKPFARERRQRGEMQRSSSLAEGHGLTRGGA